MNGLSYDIRRGNSTPAEERIADAAPDLLAACKALLQVIVEDMTHKQQSFRLAEIYAAQAAIAKAEPDPRLTRQLQDSIAHEAAKRGGA